MKPKNIIPIATYVALTAISAYGSLKAEEHQALVKAGEVAHQWYTGYLSDGLAATTIASISGIAGHAVSSVFDTAYNIRDKMITKFGVGLMGAAVVMESLDLIIPQGTFDPIDIGVYWLGIGAIVGFNKLVFGKRKNDSIDDLTNYENN